MRRLLNIYSFTIKTYTNFTFVFPSYNSQEKMENARLAQQKRRMIMFEKRSKKKKKKQYGREKTLQKTRKYRKKVISEKKNDREYGSQ